MLLCRVQFISMVLALWLLAAVSSPGHAIETQQTSAVQNRLNSDGQDAKGLLMNDPSNRLEAEQTRLLNESIRETTRRLDDLKKDQAQFLLSTEKLLGELSQQVNLVADGYGDLGSKIAAQNTQIERVEIGLRIAQEASAEAASNAAYRDQEILLMQKRLTYAIGGCIGLLLFMSAYRHFSNRRQPNASTVSHGIPLRSRHQASRGDSLSIRKNCDIPLKSLPGEQENLAHLLEEEWFSVPTGAAWQERWPIEGRFAIAMILKPGTDSARKSAAFFAAYVWAKFASQFEPDRQAWEWTAEQCQSVMPNGWTFKMLDVRPGAPYNRHSNEITEARGEGQFIEHVIFPGCSVIDERGQNLHAAGASVVKGD